MKRESRILIITHPDERCPYIALVVRGARGLDKIVLRSTCEELVQELLSDSILGEVSYVYTDANIGKGPLARLYKVRRLKTLSGFGGVDIVIKWLNFAQLICYALCKHSLKIG